MKNFHDYWCVSAVRGAFALIAATAIVAFPRAAADLYNIPVLLAFAIGIFALYSFFDLTVHLIGEGMLPNPAGRPRMLYPRAAIAFAIVVLLFLVGYRVIPLTWLMWLIAAQAALYAAAQIPVARRTIREYHCLSCYATAIVLLLAAIALPWTGWLTPANTTLALGAYLTFVGATEMTVAARMLFLEYRVQHPAHPLDETWKLTMERAVPAAFPAVSTVSRPEATAAAPACNALLTCDTCSYDERCRDNSVSAQVAMLLAARQPSLVNSVRAQTLLRSAR